MDKPEIAQYKPCLVHVEEGKRYFWCTCGRSKRQPFCDSSHRGTDFLPLVWTADKTEEKLFCACKRTRSEPFCDGTHNSLSDTYAEATEKDGANARLVDYLRAQIPDPRLCFEATTFEAADLPEGGFDLGYAASSFHWLDTAVSLEKVASLLRPGGAWAMWWNIHQDPDRPHPFGDAVAPLMLELRAEAPSFGDEPREALPGGLPLFMARTLRVDDRVAEKMVECGIQGVGISIDSTDPEKHDAFRGGPDAWRHSMKALEVCRAHGIQANTSSRSLTSSLARGEPWLH